MKTTQLKLAMLLMVLASSQEFKAQEDLYPSINTYSYKNAIGLRAGETAGFTYKHMFNERSAFEGILGVWPFTVGITGLYEYHIPTGAPGLNFYFGGGGHFNVGPKRSSYYAYTGRNNYLYVESPNTVAAGVDGIVGVEYKFKPIPLAISTDLKPYAETNSYGRTFFALDPSIGVKFTF